MGKGLSKLQKSIIRFTYAHGTPCFGENGEGYWKASYQKLKANLFPDLYRFDSEATSFLRPKGLAVVNKYAKDVAKKKNARAALSRAITRLEKRDLAFSDGSGEFVYLTNKGVDIAGALGTLEKG